jgi:hypothetical protein
MKQFKAEISKLNPKSTINSYKSFGYNLSTAISDIIDNSISANANEIRIDYKWNGQDSFISIYDNGRGIDLDKLIIAMTLGSKDPEEERNKKDLGRFRMGLKQYHFLNVNVLFVLQKEKIMQQ